MSCEHASTTTLLWLYNETDEDHVHHVAACADCTAVVAEHEEVAAMVSPVLPGAPAALAVVPAAAPVAGGRGALFWAGGLAVAAAAVMALGLSLGQEEAPVELATLVDTDSMALTRTVWSGDLTDSLDDELDDLAWALDDLGQDLSTL